MGVRHEFKYTPAEGKEFVPLEIWVESLTADEQATFHASKARQLQYREEAIANGTLVVAGPANDQHYVWKDEQAADKNKKADEEWRAFFDRWLVETNQKFEIIEINE